MCCKQHSFQLPQSSEAPALHPAPCCHAAVHDAARLTASPVPAMLQNQCCTCIMLAVNDVVVAVVAVTDPLKPEARGVIAALHQMGMSCHLVTGDNWRTARSIAEQLGIINVVAECLPGAKAGKIKVAPGTCEVLHSSAADSGAA